MSSWLISRPRYLNSTIEEQNEPVLLGTQGGRNGFLQISLQRVHPPPHRRRADARHIAGRHQQLCFVGFQWLGRRAVFGPPNKPAFREPLLCEPVSLAVIAEEPNRRPPAAPEHEHAAGRKGPRRAFPG